MRARIYAFMLGDKDGECAPINPIIGDPWGEMAGMGIGKREKGNPIFPINSSLEGKGASLSGTANSGMASAGGW